MKRKTMYGIYFGSLLALAGLFFLCFAGTFSGGVGAPAEAKKAYTIMLAGVGVLVAQALFLFRFVFSELETDEERITELSTRLEQMATLDELTKVYNRRTFDLVAGREVTNALRYNSKLSAIIFDVDNFRVVNEKHGYRIGDKVLVDLAAFMRRSIRQGDYLFRWRGGRFIILATNIGVRKAALFAEKIRRIVEESTFGDLHITVSLGAVELERGETVEAFTSRVKQALAEAKSSGGNAVTVLGLPESRSGDIPGAVAAN